jgi:hypothetical protein
MSTKARAGVGATFEIDTGSGFVHIADLVSIGGPDLSVEEVEATSLDSTSGYKEFVPGMLDGGTFTATLNFSNSANQREIRSLVGSIATADFRMILPTSPLCRIEFTGNVSTWSQSTEPNSPMTAEVGFQASGVVAFYGGTAAATVFDGNANRQGRQTTLTTVFNNTGGEVGAGYGIVTNQGYGFAPTVAQGAVIASATLTLPLLTDPNTWSPPQPNTGDNPAQWGSSHTIVGVQGSTAWATTAAVPAPAGQHDIDVTALVQHVVNRGGWVSGNRMNFALWMTNSPGNSDQRLFDNDNAVAHLLIAV